MNIGRFCSTEYVVLLLDGKNQKRKSQDMSADHFLFKEDHHLCEKQADHREPIPFHPATEPKPLLLPAQRGMFLIRPPYEIKYVSCRPNPMKALFPLS